MIQPTLKGDRLYLRPLKESDITDEYLSWLSDPTVTRHLEVGIFPENAASVRQWLKGMQSGAAAFAFAIIDKATGRHIGNIALYDVNYVMHGVDDGKPGWEHRNVGTGIIIGRKEFWGKGYGTEAHHLVFDYAFRHLKIHKVVHRPVGDNVGSYKMVTKLGLKYEGVLRKHVFIDGEFRDIIVMGMFKEDYYNSKNPEGAFPDQNDSPAKVNEAADGQAGPPGNLNED
jgi:RimJ/RimL family protein N-acetyltransferase